MLANCSRGSNKEIVDKWLDKIAGNIKPEQVDEMGTIMGTHEFDIRDVLKYGVSDAEVLYAMGNKDFYALTGWKRVTVFEYNPFMTCTSNLINNVRYCFKISKDILKYEDKVRSDSPIMLKATIPVWYHAGMRWASHLGFEPGKSNDSCIIYSRMLGGLNVN